MTVLGTNETPDSAYTRFKAVTTSLKGYSASRANKLTSGGDSKDVFAIAHSLHTAYTTLLEIEAVPGLGAWAASQESAIDPNYDVVAESTALRALLVDAVTEITANFPTDGNGYLLAYTMTATGEAVARVFPAAAFTTLIAALQAINSAVT